MGVTVPDPDRRMSSVEELQHFALALENIEEGVDMATPDNLIRYVNTAYARMHGCSREELIGQPLAAFVPNDQVLVDDDAIRASPNNRWQGEVVRLRKNGERFIDYLTVTHVRDDTGRVIGRMGVHRDVTYRGRAHAEAQRMSRENQALAQISQVIDSSPNIRDVYDQVAHLVRTLISFDSLSINQTDRGQLHFDTVYNFTVDQPEGVGGRRTPMAGMFVEGIVRARSTLLFQAVEVDEVASTYPGLLRMFEGGFRSFLGTPLISNDGLIGTLHLSSKTPNAYTDRDVAMAERVGAQIAGAVANDQLRSQLEVGAMEREILVEIGRIVGSSLVLDQTYPLVAEQVRRVMEVDRISIYVIPPDSGMMTLSFVSGTEIRGWDTGSRSPIAGGLHEVVVRLRQGLLGDGELMAQLVARSPAERDGLEAGLLSTIAVPMVSGDEVVGLLYVRSKKRDAYTARNLGVLERIGALTAGAIASAQLQVERKKLQDQLFQYQKMEALGRLAGGVAHDFNNLLTPIIAFSALGRSLVSPDSRLSEYLVEIEKAGERAAQLARQLMAFSRHQVIEPQLANLNDLIMNVDRMLRRIIGEHIELIFLPGQDLGMISVDFAQLEQVLIDLVVSARDALPGGGRIIIETGNVVLDDEYARLHSHVQPGDYVLLSVTDTGSGMHEELIEHTFEPFNTTKEASQGTGLGLSTSYVTISQLRGHITVESEPGKGSTFSVYLPRAEQASSSEGVQPGGSQPPGGSETVMVVEDETVVLRVACETLRIQGYTVLEASNGYQALWLAQEHSNDRIDLLLTDLVMPLMGGKELAVQFKLEHPETKVLYFSGYTDDSSLDQVEPDEDIAFLGKPFTPASLARHVRRTLDGGVQRRAS
jgi:PAS domain S-box-containing protein